MQCDVIGLEMNVSEEVSTKLKEVSEDQSIGGLAYASAGKNAINNLITYYLQGQYFSKYMVSRTIRPRIVNG